MQEILDISRGHPIVAFGTRRGWSRTETAEYFGIPYGVFRRIVTGWAGISLSRAQDLAAESEGEFSAMDLLLWHQSNRRDAA